MMSETMRPKTTSRVIVPAIIGFLLGLFIGLVVLGWWLWPVKWQGGSLEVVDSAIQQEFLRAAIDSYAYRPDETLALLRYEALGDAQEVVLAQVYANPRNQNTRDIERFAAAVGAEAALQREPLAEATPQAQPAAPALGGLMERPRLYGLAACAITVLLILATLIIAVLVTRRKQHTKAPPTQGEPIGASNLRAEPQRTSELAAEMASADLTPTEMGELPNWLQTSAPESYETIRLSEEEALPQTATGSEVIAESMDEIAEAELSDEDIVAITSQGVPETGLIDESYLAQAAPFERHPSETEAPPVEESWLFEAPEERQEIETSGSEPFQNVETSAFPEAAPSEHAKPTEETEIGELETPEETFAKFSQDIQYVEGIGQVYAEKLRAAGVTAPLLLLKKGATPDGRQQIAQVTEISEKLILKWVQTIDLYRIKGVDHVYAALLESVGVKTVADLAEKQPQDLYQRLSEAAVEKNIPAQSLTPGLISNWISQAKVLPRTIQY